MAVETKTLAPPDSNVAKNKVVNVQDAETKIKALIADDYAKGVPLKLTKQKVIQIISECIRPYLNKPKQFDSIKVSLTNFFNNAYYVHTENMKAINLAIVRQLTLAKKITKDMVVTAGTKSYTLNVQTLLTGENVIHPTDLITNERFRGLRAELFATVPQIKSYQKLVRLRYLELATMTPTAGESTLRQRAENDVRYEEALKDVNKVENSENDLWWTSTHANCSKRCESLQGKLYSKSGKSGSVDNGIRYTPLADAFAGINNDGNGIITGFGCRHYLIAYTSGSKPPTLFDSKTVDKQRELDRKQRYYETQIRLKKQQEAIARSNNDTELADRINERWKKQMASYQEISLSNGRPFYKWRTQVFKESNLLVKDEETID